MLKVATWGWWDYRMNAFRRNMGLRIDLMRTGPHIAPVYRH
jgi:exonuclease III